MPDSLPPHGLQPTRLLCPWDFAGKDTGLGCHFLLQGIFPTQGSNPGLLYYRQVLYHLKHQVRVAIDNYSGSQFSEAGKNFPWYLNRKSMRCLKKSSLLLWEGQETCPGGPASWLISLQTCHKLHSRLRYNSQQTRLLDKETKSQKKYLGFHFILKPWEI